MKTESKQRLEEHQTTKVILRTLFEIQMKLEQLNLGNGSDHKINEVIELIDHLFEVFMNDRER